MSLAFQSVLRYESAFIGLTEANLSEELDGYSVADALVMMFVDCILYFLLAWYLDKTVATPFGTSQRWYFCCLPSYWCASCRKAGKQPAVSESEALVGRTSSIMEVPEELAQKPGIRIRQLRKEFEVHSATPCSSTKDPHVAVHGLQVDMFEGQIFVLLGHNGAGKTTTINMLTGMLPISSGSAEIYGLDAGKDMAAIRNFLGVCPQHDILFPALTVSEHLQMYAQLKVPPVRLFFEEKSQKLGAVNSRNHPQRTGSSR
jgi:ABC-type multidrug transport system fused ATPase/permease subunit